MRRRSERATRVAGRSPQGCTALVRRVRVARVTVFCARIVWRRRGARQPRACTAGVGIRVALPAGVITHYFSVDVEEYFQVNAFAPYLPSSAWGALDPRVVGCVERVVELLGRYETRATFFVVGWVAERHPDVVRTLARAGHEVAAHGWDHVRIGDQSPL